MAIRSHASSAIYSRFAGRDVNLRAVVRLFGVDLLCAAEFKALCDGLRASVGLLLACLF